MPSGKNWSLGAKLGLLGAPFLFLVLLSTAATLWISWQLDGGAAAVNEAGRMRMQTYRMSLSVGIAAPRELLARQVEEFDASLTLLHNGDPERPLFVPWDEPVLQSFAVVTRDWSVYRKRWLESKPATLDGLRTDTDVFVAEINALVIAIEAHMSHWTALLHVLQMLVLTMAIVVTVLLVYTGYVFVLEPVGKLKHAFERIQQGNFDARVEHVSSDEFGALAGGFNGMAENLQSMYRNLEQKVAEKTSELEEKRERLEGLYEISALVVNSTQLDDLAQGFARSVARIARADGITVRWTDHDNQRYLMLAAQGMPQALVDAEQCIDKGNCYCGAADSDPGLRVIPIRSESEAAPMNCAAAGFKTVINIPIRLHERTMGEVDLFFHARVAPTPALRSLLDALASHLASGMENLRLNALEKEAAIAQERGYLAHELHDSIAQSLAFTKIQVQLMRDAVHGGDATAMLAVLDEIDTGVRECYGDVRELLLHFRTRTNVEDIEPALATTLRKFEHQSGIGATLKMQGHGMPLSPDVQLQVLHIIQESLSNVRKHAQATQVLLDVQQQPAWRFAVSDDGVGFVVDNEQLDETHVGLRIMKERAQRLGATLHIVSTPGRGSTITLILPPPAQAMPPVLAAAGFRETSS